MTRERRGGGCHSLSPQITLKTGFVGREELKVDLPRDTNVKTVLREDVCPPFESLHSTLDVYQ